MTDPSSSFPKKNVLIVDANQQNNIALKNWFSSQPEFEVAGVFQSPHDALKVPSSISAKLALIGIDIPNGIKFCKILQKRNPAVSIIALVSASSEDVEISLRQAGALESLKRGANPSQIFNAVQAVSSIEGSTLCSIVGIGGIKEGVGATLQTAILGDFLGRKLPGKILLLDLDFLRGDLAYTLGQSSKMNVQSLASRDNFLHPEVLQTFVTKTDRGFSLLPAAQDPELQILSDISLVGLLTVLGNYFEVILIDLPSYPFHGLKGVIDICDSIVFNIGETSNQIKSLAWMISSDFKKMPENFSQKYVFVSWSQDPAIRQEIERLAPNCMFLPKPQKAQYNNPAFTINDAKEFETLRVALDRLLERIPALFLYSASSVPFKSDEEPSASNLLSKLINFIVGK